MITQKRLKELMVMTPNGRFIRLIGVGGGVRSGETAGFKHGHGHREIRIDNANYREHQLVWLYVTGNWPVESIYHVNKVRDHNNFGNLCYRSEIDEARENYVPDFLRTVTEQSKRTRPPIQPPNTPPPPLRTVKRPQSKHSGIHWHPRKNKWVAWLGVDRIGEYDNESDAIDARKSARLFI